MEYFTKQWVMDVINNKQFEFLKDALKNSDQKWYHNLFEGLQGTLVSEETFQQKAKEIIDIIILEDVRKELNKCDSWRVRDYLREWLEQWNLE